jgi:hypothetical protein
MAFRFVRSTCFFVKKKRKKEKEKEKVDHTRKDIK